MSKKQSKTPGTRPGIKARPNNRPPKKPWKQRIKEFAKQQLNKRRPLTFALFNFSALSLWGLAVVLTLIVIILLILSCSGPQLGVNLTCLAEFIKLFLT